MEEFNFESQLRSKLNERSIQPSENAWDRVANRPKKKKKSSAPWYWIAAAVVVGLGLFLAQYNSRMAPQQNAVSETPKSPAAKAGGDITPEVISPPEEIQQVALTATEIDSPKLTVTPNKQKLPEVTLALRPETTAVTQHVNDIVAHVEKLQRSGTDVTEEMLDSMIRSSRIQIAAERLSKQQKTDATALLGEAEKDLDRSFKDRIFEALHKKIKIALSN